MLHVWLLMNCVGVLHLDCMLSTFDACWGPAAWAKPSSDSGDQTLTQCHMADNDGGTAIKTCTGGVGKQLRAMNALSHAVLP